MDRKYNPFFAKAAFGAFSIIGPLLLLAVLWLVLIGDEPLKLASDVTIKVEHILTLVGILTVPFTGYIVSSRVQDRVAARQESSLRRRTEVQSIKRVLGNQCRRCILALEQMDKSLQIKCVLEYKRSVKFTSPEVRLEELTRLEFGRLVGGEGIFQMFLSTIDGVVSEQRLPEPHTKKLEKLREQITIDRNDYWTFITNHKCYKNFVTEIQLDSYYRESMAYFRDVIKSLALLEIEIEQWQE